MISNTGFDPSDFLITAFVPPVQMPPENIQGARSAFTEMLTSPNNTETKIHNSEDYGKSVLENEQKEKITSEIASIEKSEKNNSINDDKAETIIDAEEILSLLTLLQGNDTPGITEFLQTEGGADIKDETPDIAGVPLETFVSKKENAANAAIKQENDIISPLGGDTKTVSFANEKTIETDNKAYANETDGKPAPDALPDAAKGVFVDRVLENSTDIHIAETNEKVDIDTKESAKNEKTNIVNEKTSENLTETAQKMVNNKNNDKNEWSLNEKNSGGNKNSSDLKKKQKIITEVSTQTVQSGGSEVKETTKITQANGKETEITVNLRSEAKNFAASEQVMRDAKPQVSLENFLARELHQNLNGDIVRQASVMLREGGAGTIRLSLKPESLGNVKIMLEMSENKIQGHITVESNEAMRAFTQELKALEQTFRDNGYENASLTLDQHEQNSAQNGETNENAPFFVADKASGQKYEENTTGIVRITGDYGNFFDKRVNIFA